MGDNLARRVAAVPAEPAGQPSVAQLIESLKPQIARALPKHMDADRMARIALTLLRQTPKLAECSPQSFLGALMTASQLGLEPGPLGESYLVPFRNNKTGNMEVQFIPGYRGLVKLAWNSGQLRNIDAHVVHEGDEFDYEYGLNPFLRHKPARGNGTAGTGAPTEVYAVATLLNGGSGFVVMSIQQVEAIRKRSKSATNGPWVTDWEAMAKKTAIKQLIRFLPLSVEMQPLNTAAHLDGTVRTDATAQLTEAEPAWVDSDAIEAAPEYAELETGESNA